MKTLFNFRRTIKLVNLQPRKKNENKEEYKLPMSGMKWEITTDPTDTKRLIRGYGKQLYTHI